MKLLLLDSFSLILGDIILVLKVIDSIRVNPVK